MGQIGSVPGPLFVAFLGDLVENHRFVASVLLGSITCFLIAALAPNGPTFLAGCFSIGVRGYASRHARTNRATALMMPGWARTDLGGPDADLELDESILGVVDSLSAQVGRPGLRFVDETDRTFAWLAD
jgi:hypothetical protein